MRTGRLGAVSLAILTVVALLLSGCNSIAPTSVPETSKAAATTVAPSEAPVATPEPDPWGKYPETIALTTDTIFAGWMTLEDGEDQDNNWWTKIYLEKLNIKLTNKWAADGWGTPMDEKFNQALASDDLPDIIYGYSSLAVKAIKNDKVQDIKGVYEQYASQQLKDIYTTDKNVLRAWEVDGKLFGLCPSVSALPDRPGFWVRKDWLDKLGMSVPKTIADVENAARAFMRDNPGQIDGLYGIGAAWDSGIVDEIYPYFNLSTGNWLDVDGKLIRKTQQPGIKDVWQKFADWYKEGLLPKDFAVKKADPDINQDISTGKCGVWWGSYGNVVGSTAMLDLKKRNNDAEFAFILPPTVDGKKAHYVANYSYDGAVMVNVKCKYPESLIKLLNLGTAIFNEPKPDFITDMSYQHGATGKGWAEFWRCVGMSCPTNPFQGGWDARAAREALETGDTSKLSFIAKNEYYDKMKSWLDNGKNDENWVALWAQYQATGPDSIDEMITQLNEAKEDYSYSPWWGMETDSMAKYGQNWFQKFREYRTMAIVNNNVQEQFDAWVAYFQANGGIQATEEANQWYATHK